MSDGPELLDVASNHLHLGDLLGERGAIREIRWFATEQQVRVTVAPTWWRWVRNEPCAGGGVFEPFREPVYGPSEVLDFTLDDTVRVMRGAPVPQLPDLDHAAEDCGVDR